ncbi:ProQ/FINO family protein [Paraburkholderia adhaesiva]|uniref:ProQ/FINO family protein n=1 Tax=Paraburkholderia adhaesiva TaxID=2883244 RepID=UPI001F2C154D|nr:ProQ/FINO family protein [Paraburkholderia adhaesiva]
MKAASQQRRTLSFKEGLLEIKKSMGKGSGQTPEEQDQAPQDKPARKGQPALATDKDARAKDARSRPRPQQPGGRPQGGKPQQPKQARPQKPGERPAQQRQRPARAPVQPAANLSDAEKARIERNRQLNTVWNLFAKHYPAFRDRLPLKIGVAEDLVARHPDFDRTLIVAVLKRHVNHPRYHERVAAGGSRYELDGSVSAGPGIDPSHVGRANAALARQKAKAEAREQEKGGGKPESKPQDAVQAPAADAQPQHPQAGAPAQAAIPEGTEAPAQTPASEGVEPPAAGA